MVETNRQLQQEIHERRQVEAELRLSRKRLELFHEMALGAASCGSRTEIAGFVVERCGRAFPDAEVSFVGAKDGRLVVRNSTAHEDPEWGIGGSPDLKDTYLTQLGSGDMVVSDVAALVAHPIREGKNVTGFVRSCRGSA